MPDITQNDAYMDIVTPLTTAILRQAGDSAYRLLVVTGQAPASALQALKGVTPQQLFARPIKEEDDARAALAGLWLWHDALNESHEITQNIISPTGSLWHAIMHRREGDFSNAKYWYRRCESHRVVKMMGAIASSLAGEFASDRLVAHALGDSWNPLGFVDLVEAVAKKHADPRHELAIRLQQAEWEGLFNHCILKAVDADVNSLDDWDRRVMNPSGN